MWFCFSKCFICCDFYRGTLTLTRQKKKKLERVDSDEFKYCDAAGWNGASTAMFKKTEGNVWLYTWACAVVTCGCCYEMMMTSFKRRYYSGSWMLVAYFLPVCNRDFITWFHIPWQNLIFAQKNNAND